MKLLKSFWPRADTDRSEVSVHLGGTTARETDGRWRVEFFCGGGIMLVLATMQVSFLPELRRVASLPVWLLTTGAAMVVISIACPYSASIGVLLVVLNAGIVLPRMFSGEQPPATLTEP